MPRELNGTLYRNGPNPQFDAPNAHWFVGDGMLHAFHLENGRASYRNRWVRTAKWQAEHEAGRALFGGFGQKLPDAPASLTDGGVANTNIIFHGGKLLALEEQHLPTEIEPETLATRGHCNFDGAIGGPFTAHPKVDPVTGELFFFGYNAAGPFTPALSFGSIDAGGRVTRFDRFDAPYASMVHDFIVTERHLLFPILPITGSMDARHEGPAALRLGARQGRLCRRDEAQRRGEGHRLVPRRELLCLPRHERLGRRRPHHRRRHAVRGSAAVSRIPTARAPIPTSRARVWRAGPSTSPAIPTASSRPISTISPANFRASTIAAPALPTIMAGTPAPIPSWRCSTDFPASRMSTARASVSPSISCPLGDAISEPVFVERNKQAAEGDGWLLAAVWRANENTSDLAVFNATDVEAGPVALVHLGHRVPDGFHGNWVGAAEPPRAGPGSLKRKPS